MTQCDDLKNMYVIPDCDIVHNGKVYGLKDSVIRSKFPMSTDISQLNSVITPGIQKLAQSEIGSGHDQWLVGVIAQFDLTFSLKAWPEIQRYHFFDFVSSQSTMHRITRFDLRKSMNSYVDPRVVEILEEKVRRYNAMVEQNADANALKEQYRSILYNNPAGFMLTAGVTTNYRQIKTQRKQRLNHRLEDWTKLCAWYDTLPHSELFRV